MIAIRLPDRPEPLAIPALGVIEVTDAQGRLAGLVKQSADGSVSVILPPDDRLTYHAMMHNIPLANTIVHK